jgi:carboxyl-terminal processing protease
MRRAPLPALLLATVATLAAPRALSAQASATGSGPLDAARRAWIASRVYRAIELYYGHWDDVPDLDLDAAYRTYLDEAMTAPDRRAFSLATQAFVARLHNSHSAFSDRALWGEAGAPHGYWVRPLGDRWVVTLSQRPGLSPGDVLASVDGEPIEAFYARNRRYLNASTERYARRRLFFDNQRQLWPQTYTLGLADGRTVPIEGDPPPFEDAPDVVEGRWIEPDDVAYIRVGSWNDPGYQQKAIELLREYRDARALVVDVRGNGGGSSPIKFIRALMERPWRWYAEASPMRIAVFANNAERGREGWGDFRRPAMSWPASVETADSLYTGRLAILIDGGCHSACEDFVMPFKDNGRAVLVGEATAGSSGQPYFENLGDGMFLAVGMKREFFPDGSAFEGVGVAPDAEVIPTAEDLRAGRDPELERALRLLDGG